MIDLALKNYMREELRSTPIAMRRYMYDRIPWNDRMIGIMGPRGVGKSTMVKQFLLSTGLGDDAILYVSADHTYFADHRLTDIADDFVLHGGKYLAIDEIHKYHGWSRELKQIYDVHPGLHIIFTGSSILDLQTGWADLSRRALMFSMQGLSFREYLHLFKGIESRVYSLEEILNNEVRLPSDVLTLPLFQEYLASGYYPFSESPRFDIRLQQVISQTIEVDIPQYANLTPGTSRKLKRLLSVISQLAPFKPNMLNLSTELGVSKNSIPDYLVFLEKTGLISRLQDSAAGLRNLGKIEKIYLDNPSLMTVLAGGMPDLGNLRETFFFNQMRVNHSVTASKISDFEIGQYTFELGGHRKGRRQLVEAPHGVVVRDDIVQGADDIVPLWTFGMNY